MDSNTKFIIIIAFFLGVFAGLILSYFVVLKGIEVIGTSFRIENMNVSIALNQSQLIDAIQNAANNSART